VWQQAGVLLASTIASSSSLLKLFVHASMPNLGNLIRAFIFWQHNEGGINVSWYISRGNHSHLLEKGIYRQKKSPEPYDSCIGNHVQKHVTSSQRHQFLAGDMVLHNFACFV
jgi:hypothetical protein